MNKLFYAFLYLFWKEWLFMRRHCKVTVSAVIIPALLYLPIFIVRNYYPQFAIEKRDITYYSTFDPLTAKQMIVGTDEELFLFAPFNENTTHLMKRAFLRIKSRFHSFPRLVGVKDEQSLESIAKSRKKIRGSVIFYQLNLNGFININYKLRFPNFYSLISRNYLTTNLETRNWELENEYYSSGFLLFQHAIETTFIEMIQEGEAKRNFVMELHRLPTSAYSGYQLLIILDFLPYIVVYGLIACVSIIVVKMTTNKTNEKEILLVSGVNRFLILICDFTVSLLLIALSLSLLLIEIFCLKSRFDILIYSQDSLFCMIFFIYAFNATLFLMFLSSVFQHPDINVLFCILTWIITHTLPTISIFPYYKRDMKSVYKFIFCLFPNAALQWICRIISLSEANGKGVKWNNINESGFTDDFSISKIISMMLLSSIIYSSFWISKYYLLRCVHRFSINVINEWDWSTKYIQHKHNEAKYIDDAEHPKMEANKDGVAIHDIYKKDNSGIFPILNNLSLNFYKNQITIVLGPRNSGKSVLARIILGLESANQGKIFINGEEITPGQINKNIGWCPQTNIFYEWLTVIENLQFFSRIHGNQYSTIENIVIINILELLQLYPMKDTLGKYLLYQDSRKLSLAIAMIHDPQVLILDEPSFGFSLAETLHLLHSLKSICEKKTIIYLTRSKHEALLAENRIILLIHGNVKCSGSIAYLREKFECGCHLTIDIKDQEYSERIKNYVYSLTRNVRIEKDDDKMHIWLFSLNDTNVENEIIKFTEDKFQFKIVQLTVADILGRLTKLKNDCLCSDLVSPTGIEDYSFRVKFEEDKLKMLWQQFSILLWKKYILAKANFLHLLSYLFLASVLFVISLWSENGAKMDSSSELLNISDFLQIRNLEVFYSVDNSIMARMMEEIYYKKLREINVSVHRVENFTTYAAETNKNFIDEINSIGAIINKHLGNTLSVMGWYSGNVPYLPSLSINSFSNAFLRFVTRDQSSTIHLSSQPLTSQSDPYLMYLHKKIYFIFFYLLMPLTLHLVSYPFLIEYCRETYSSFRRLQLMTGVNVELFWITNFIFDYFIYFLWMSITLLLILLFREVCFAFFSFEHFANMAFVLFTYGFFFLPVTYIVSYIYKPVLPKFVYRIFFRILLDITILILIMLLLNPLKEFSIFVIKQFFYIFPTICIIWSLEDIYVKILIENVCPEILESLYSSICDHLMDGSIFYLCCLDYRKMPYENTYFENSMFMIIFGILYFMILLCVERHYLIFFNYKYMMINRKLRYLDILPAEALSPETVFTVVDLYKWIKLDFGIGDVSFIIKKSECFGILGPSKSGKTTLLKCLVGISFIDNGIVWFDGYNARTRYQKYRSQIGYCPQNEGLIWNFTGKQIIYLLASLRGIKKEDSPNIIEHIFTSLDLKDKLVKEYSGCEKKLLSIAISLLGCPRLIFLDEPTSHMNVSTRDNVWNILLKIKNDPLLETAFVISTSSFAECTSLCDRMAFLINGKMYYADEVKVLKERFNSGYLVTIFIDESKVNPSQLIQNIAGIFEEKNLTVFEIFAEMQILCYHIYETSIKYSHLHDFLEEKKNLYHTWWLKHILCSSSLEEVYNKFILLQSI